MTYAPPGTFDLVLCLQVLEHLECPDAFVEKLVGTGRIIVISVPYRWPEGRSKYHVQDPIDENKLLAWTKKRWIDQVVVKEANGEERIIVGLEGTRVLAG